MKKNLLRKVLLCFMLPLVIYGCGNTNNSSSTSSTPSNSSTSSSEEDLLPYISIQEAISKATEAGESGTTEEYYIKGIVEEVTNPTYGQMTVKDDTGSINVYGVYAADRETRYDALEDKPVAGDEVSLLGKLKTYNGTPEMDRGYLQKFKHNSASDKVDLSTYPEKTLLEARSLKEDEKAKLTGVVSFITYGQGMNPNGFFLTDKNSGIYVYGGQVAQQVSVGNTVTVAAEKTYYIADNEKNNAEKFGYQGCCQMENPVLVENKKDKATIDLSWAKETTIKDIIDTPLTNNITTEIFKVNSYVRKAPGSGFTNYYFNDLDGKTGSYTYTSNNGSDFSWLDEFDGKICTVYLSPLNCKSTATGCVYRFIPLQVKDENFKFDVKNAPQFAIDYYAKDQFKTTYTADPALELITSVSSDILGFEDAKLTYTSNNTNSVDIVNEDSKTVLHTKNVGKATVTINASYQTYTATATVDIEVKEEIKVDAVNVKAAIDAQDGTEITVKGIVMSSLVNQTGFYLNDETGVISIRLASSDTLSDIHLGDEVIISGTKDHFKKTEGTFAGQAAIVDAELVTNNYGNHTYSEASFVESTFDELYAKINNVTEDYTTTVYKIEAKITSETSKYFSNYYVNSPTTSDRITLYSSSGNQYSFLEPFVDQIVTIEIALCNWNAKNPYKASIIAVVTDSGKVINSFNF